MKICPNCRGRTKVREICHATNFNQLVICHTCRGSGQVPEITPKMLAVINKIVKGYTGEQVLNALGDYGAWHLPTLKEECENTLKTLQRVNPEGGGAWGILNQMRVVIALRESGLLCDCVLD